MGGGGIRGKESEEREMPASSITSDVAVCVSADSLRRREAAASPPPAHPTLLVCELHAGRHESRDQIPRSVWNIQPQSHDGFYQLEMNSQRHVGLSLLFAVRIGAS